MNEVLILVIRSLQYQHQHIEKLHRKSYLMYPIENIIEIFKAFVQAELFWMRKLARLKIFWLNTNSRQLYLH